ncbi:MAG: TraR/DksA family transcriptional regulator [Candidatus Accumulibacter sp.]|uniref:TraR/DksA family transcriptional regulator n=1 Tax=Accumulibacter sp. TaxID=2053492 RepID=UPI001A55881C|nr:TraR/DksA family transcriptional regulator [Accumulibacter sp.]MBL8396138.1 TraR/DksA family transcriptional regulator [Accumulibacter sp.]
MTDQIDRAQERDQEILSEHIYQHGRLSGLSGRSIDDSSETCVDCGERIPEARRAIYPGVKRCVYCQRDRERTARVR